MNRFLRLAAFRFQLELYFDSNIWSTWLFSIQIINKLEFFSDILQLDFDDYHLIFICIIFADSGSHRSENRSESSRPRQNRQCRTTFSKMLTTSRLSWVIKQWVALSFCKIHLSSLIDTSTWYFHCKDFLSLDIW